MSSSIYTAQKGLKHIGSEVGSWLNTVSSVADGTELIKNGKFTQQIKDWYSVSGGLLSYDSGTLKVTIDTADTSGRAEQSIITIVGVVYIVFVNVTAEASSTALGIGSVSDGGDISITTLAVGGNLVTFTAVGVTTYLNLRANGVAGDSSNFDDISVTKAELIGVDETTELATNGTFASDLSGWTYDPSYYRWNAGGYAERYNTGITKTLQQSISTISGLTYKLTFNVLAATLAPTLSVGGVVVDSDLDPGSYEFIFRATSTSTAVIFSTGGSTLDLDNVSVKRTGNLITNGDFTSGIVGWTDFDAGTILSFQSGELRIENGDASAAGANSTGFNVVEGMTYIISFESSQQTATTAGVLFGVADGSSSLNRGSKTDTTNGNHYLSFTAQETATYYFLVKTNSAVSAEYIHVDNISIRLADPDLSTNDHDLAFFGQIAKSAVAPGSTVMAYSNFSADNYLKQSYDSALDFGTGDFTIGMWFKIIGESGAETFIARGDNTNDDFVITINHSSGDIEVGYLAGSFVTPTLNATAGVWYNLTVTRSSGVLYVYQDGVLLDSGSDSQNWTTKWTDAYLVIGARATAFANPADNSVLALNRILNTTLTATQIKTIYDAEKHMFKENSIFTQVGEEYSIETKENVLNRDNTEESTPTVSVGGNQETVLQRNDIFHIVTFHDIHQDELPKYRTFLDSVAGGAVFSFDPYGTIDNPHMPVNVIADSGYTESRDGVTKYFTIQMRLREVD